MIQIYSWTFITWALSSAFTCLAIPFISLFLIWRNLKDHYVIVYTSISGECPLYFSALQNSQNVFKVFILTVTIRSPQVQLSDTRTVTKTARKSTRSYSFIAHSLATQEFPVIVDFIYWFSLHSCQNSHVLFVTQYDNNTFPTRFFFLYKKMTCTPIFLVL